MLNLPEKVYDVSSNFNDININGERCPGVFKRTYSISLIQLHQKSAESVNKQCHKFIELCMISEIGYVHQHPN